MTQVNDDGLTILGQSIRPGESKEVNFDVANLHTSSPVNVPVIIERSKKPGPTVLFTAGIHGDEVNGVEIVRQLIAKGINKPKCGTIICMPVINIFGFINLKREFPDGRDLNRVFPGSTSGSLAGRVAYKLMHDIIPHVDLIIDFHTGGSGRFNAPQLRYSKENKELNDLAKIFGAPFVLYSKNVSKSFRTTCYKLGKPLLLFEGGKSFHIDDNVTNSGVNGSKRILKHLGIKTSVGGGFLYVPERNYQYSEILFGANRILKLGRQRVKLGVYYILAHSNTQGVSAGFKFSLNPYNINNNTWSF